MKSITIVVFVMIIIIVIGIVLYFKNKPKSITDEVYRQMELINQNAAVSVSVSTLIETCNTALAAIKGKYDQAETDEATLWESLDSVKKAVEAAVADYNKYDPSSGSDDGLLTTTTALSTALGELGERNLVKYQTYFTTMTTLLAAFKDIVMTTVRTAFAECKKMVDFRLGFITDHTFDMNLVDRIINPMHEEIILLQREIDEIILDLDGQN
jgi:hypothetical protein